MPARITVLAAQQPHQLIRRHAEPSAAEERVKPPLGLLFVGSQHHLAVIGQYEIDIGSTLQAEMAAQPLGDRYLPFGGHLRHLRLGNTGFTQGNT